jgi:deoxyribose-phosphate aldolase
MENNKDKKEEMIEQIKEMLVRIKEATAAIGNAAREALINGNNEPMKKALENYEREVEKINNNFEEKQYEEKELILISLIYSDEIREIRQIIEDINPDFIRKQCGIV